MEKQINLDGNPFLVKAGSPENCVEFVAGPYEGRVTLGPDKKINFSIRKGINSFNDTEWSADGYNGRISFHARKMGVYWRAVEIELILRNGIAYPQFLNPSVPSLQSKARELRAVGIALDEQGCMSMDKTLAVLTALERHRLHMPKHLAHDYLISQLEEKMRAVIKVRDAAENAARLEADVERIKEKQPEVAAFIRKNTVPGHL
jgi:vacuolar-type H+-ATPase subunit I/STV1